LISYLSLQTLKNGGFKVRVGPYFFGESISELLKNGFVTNLKSVS